MWGYLPRSKAPGKGLRTAEVGGSNPLTSTGQSTHRSGGLSAPLFRSGPSTAEVACSGRSPPQVRAPFRGSPVGSSRIRPAARRRTRPSSKISQPPRCESTQGRGSSRRPGHRGRFTGLGDVVPGVPAQGLPGGLRAGNPIHEVLIKTIHALANLCMVGDDQTTDQRRGAKSQHPEP